MRDEPSLLTRPSLNLNDAGAGTESGPNHKNPPKIKSYNQVNRLILHATSNFDYEVYQYRKWKC